MGIEGKTRYLDGQKDLLCILKEETVGFRILQAFRDGEERWMVGFLTSPRREADAVPLTRFYNFIFFFKPTIHIHFTFINFSPVPRQA
jgi:hypothetical protein